MNLIRNSFKDVSIVITMRLMFYNCSKFNQNCITTWDIGNVKYLNFMFFNCMSFNQQLFKNYNYNKTICIGMMSNTPKFTKYKESFVGYY